MGNSTSYDRNSNTVSTAKLVHEDGLLQEFESPIRVSQILRNNFFICDADHIALNEFISAMDTEDELHLGHLYLELPIIRLNSPVVIGVMAALAVKASLALDNTAHDGKFRWCCLFPVRNVQFFDCFKTDKSDHVEEVFEENMLLVQFASHLVRRRQVGGIGGGRTQQKFTSKLSVILEGMETNDIPY